MTLSDIRRDIGKRFDGFVGCSHGNVATAIYYRPQTKFGAR